MIVIFRKNKKDTYSKRLFPHRHIPKVPSPPAWVQSLDRYLTPHFHPGPFEFLYKTNSIDNYSTPCRHSRFRSLHALCFHYPLRISLLRFHMRPLALVIDMLKFCALLRVLFLLSKCWENRRKNHRRARQWLRPQIRHSADFFILPTFRGLGFDSNLRP